MKEIKSMSAEELRSALEEANKQIEELKEKVAIREAWWHEAEDRVDELKKKILTVKRLADIL